MTKKIKWSEEGYKKILEASAKGRQTLKNNFKHQYDLDPKFCKECSTVIPYIKKENLFCDQSCSATFNNRHRIVKNKISKKYLSQLNFCKCCSVKIDPRKQYCSLKCQSKFRQDSNIQLWLDNKIEGGNQYTAFKWVKKYLREQCSGACQICYQDTWLDQPMPLVCDHINGNSSDHSPQNLRMICGNCDMLLPTYKSKNKNSGRAYRRERYIQGKSY